MSIFTYTYKIAAVLFISMAAATGAAARNDSTKLFRRVHKDSVKTPLNMDAIYSRPFFQAGKLPIAIGGYMETNSQYATTDGTSEGLSFQFRQISLFFSSTIADKIRFLSEIEFEDGGKEISVEFASLDFNVNPLFNLRGGILVNPIGSFNQNHDGPKWDFVDRPLEATSILATTLSTAGFGAYGKYSAGNWVVGYEAYITNGFDDHVIDNGSSRTSLAEGQQRVDRFEESSNGAPMFTGKIAIRNRKAGELGLSYMGGIYNKWQDDGLVFDVKRRMNAMAVDYTTSFLKNRVNITGEASRVVIQLPANYLQQYGAQQWGVYTDFVGTVIRRPVLGWSNAKLDLAVRLEYADYNDGYFKEGGNIYDDLWSVVPAIAFRPVGTTVVRFNYRYQKQRDMAGNHLSPYQTSVFQLGFSTYF